MEEWEEFKKSTSSQSSLFIDSIMKGGKNGAN